MRPSLGSIGNARPPAAILLLLAACVASGDLFAAVADDDPSIFGWKTGYPGPKPGAWKIACDLHSITAANAAISVSWEWSRTGLALFSVRDLAAGRKLGLTNELFQIALADGPLYRASALVVEAEPTITELAPRPLSARLAARIPGAKVELPLRSADGHLRVVWRALFLEGANYFRQELEVTPTQADCVIEEIVWVEGAIPEARVAGHVDGSPVVASSFFFGAEDPMAGSGVKVPERLVGTWSPTNLAAGARRIASWDLDGASLKSRDPGEIAVSFLYQRGPHRLDIWRVTLFEDDREIARDQHHGHTGTSHSENTFLLNHPQLKPGARYRLAAELSTDPDFKMPPGAPVESWGRVMIRETGNQVACRVRRHAPLRKNDTLRQSFVVGVAPEGQMRRSFLFYLERERAHPYRPFLHYNSWYDTAWAPFHLNETNCIEAIRLCGERFIKPHGVVMDAMVFDDGWDDPRTLWKFHAGFPNGFTPLAELCRQYNTRLGVWLSPFGGYGEPKQQRLKFGRTRGYEINATGFSLAGANYYATFKRACVNMIRQYGVNHFKFDGIAAGMYASGGADYVLDTEAMRRLMIELRQEDPNLYINLTTGSWPSPFWLRFADSLWRQGGDMGLAGKGSRQQQWLTYRDQETCRNIVGKGPLYPLNALMTQGVAYSREGSAGDPTFNSAGFKDDVRAFFGSGTSLQELYIQPGKLTPEDWRVLAEAARWSRAHANVLVDTHWIGGDPSKSQLYGYASWIPSQGVVMLRNPDDQPHEFSLDIGRAFELPFGAKESYSLRSPWSEDASKPSFQAEAGKTLRLTLKPFEVLVLDATPLP